MDKLSLADVRPLLSAIELIPERLVTKIIALNEPTVLDGICELVFNVLSAKDKRSLKKYKRFGRFIQRNVKMFPSQEASKTSTIPRSSLRKICGPTINYLRFVSSPWQHVGGGEVQVHQKKLIQKMYKKLYEKLMTIHSSSSKLDQKAQAHIQPAPKMDVQVDTGTVGGDDDDEGFDAEDVGGDDDDEGFDAEDCRGSEGMNSMLSKNSRSNEVRRTVQPRIISGKIRASSSGRT